MEWELPQYCLYRQPPSHSVVTNLLYLNDMIEAKTLEKEQGGQIFEKGLNNNHD